MWTEELLVEPNPKLYHFIAQGMTTIDNVDDAEEMRLTDEAFDILNFSQVIYLNTYKKSIWMSINFVNFIAREDWFIQVYWCYHALW